MFLPTQLKQVLTFQANSRRIQAWIFLFYFLHVILFYFLQSSWMSTSLMVSIWIGSTRRPRTDRGNSAIKRISFISLRNWEGLLIEKEKAGKSQWLCLLLNSDWMKVIMFLNCAGRLFFHFYCSSGREYFFPGFWMQFIVWRMTFGEIGLVLLILIVRCINGRTINGRMKSWMW